MKRRVLIACPAKNGVGKHWFEQHDILQRTNHPDYAFEFVVETGHGCINFARNIIADEAIKRDVWKVVQIDADMRWLATDLIKLVSVPEPIVYGLYAYKKPGVVSWVMVKTPNAEIDERGLLQCDFVGTGMLSTEVSALRKIVEFFPERRFTYEDAETHEKRTMTELFPVGLVGPNTPEGRIARIKRALANARQNIASDDSQGEMMASMNVFMDEVDMILNTVHEGECRILGEDYHFCRLARKAGFKLWCDMTAIVGHIGDAVYPIGEEQLSKPGPFVTHNLNLDDY